MSDDTLSVIPSDPDWSPGPDAARRAASAAAAAADGDTETTWHEGIALIDCGANLERIGCPGCGAAIAPEQWADLVGACHESGFADLMAELPCCGAETPLNALDYRWPCGFARFEIKVWNPVRAWLTEEELTRIGGLLGHRVRQVRAHL
ncbi:hypothetical protein [Nocardiopsis potens]|uniref:hypothetical protein n=1 Tax=Nocardiopsis potens TaxID=1246458 RepID=UPI00034C0420|nr:hypothetical protein [Nocardiopsis potens]